MSKKLYTSVTGILYTFPVKVAGKVKWISLRGSQKGYTTSDAATQKAIEQTPYFKRGKIRASTLQGGKTVENPERTSEEPQPEAAALQAVEQVSTLQEAREYLMAAPYDVPAAEVSTPGKIKAMAAALGISFPALETTAGNA